MLTPEQQLAVEAAVGDVVVAAGAGSGKTRVLTQRYVHLLKHHGARPDQIVTITFTDAAAAEMRDRIARLLLDLGEGRWLRDVEAGYISTIHAFCLRMLKECALDVELDPNARLLSDVEAARYRIRRREALLAEHHATILPLIDRYGMATTFHAVFTLVQHGREHGLTPDELLARYAKEPEEFVAVLRRRVEQMALRLQNWFLDGVADLRHIPVPPGSKAEAARDEAADFARSLPRDRLLSIEVLYEQARRRILRMPADGGERLTRAVRMLRDETVRSRKFWHWFEARYDADAAFAEHRNAMLRIAAHEWRAFEQFKREGGYVDFLDMLTAARDLIARFPARFHERFKFVLVDEFQDTNPLQTEIIRLLTKGQNAFVVGDARQSIYRFRQADVGVFREFEQRARDPLSAAELLPLTENFRSVPPVLGFVDGLFRRMWEVRDADLGANPLQPGRDLVREAVLGGLLSDDEAQDADTSPETVLARGIAGPRVELLLFDPAHVSDALASSATSASGSPSTTTAAGDGRNGSRSQNASALRRREAVALEAEQVARRVVHLVEVERPRVFDPLTNRYRRLRYGDVAVLLSARTYLDTFEVLFETYRVPYLSLGGRAYFSRPEVVDLANALAITVNPRQDIKLAAVWRSPLVGLSDDGLYWIAKSLEVDIDETWAAVTGDIDSETDNETARKAPVDPEEERPVRGIRKRKRLLFEALDLPDDVLAERLDPADLARFQRFRTAYRRLAERRATLSSAEVLAAWIDDTDLRTTLQTQRHALQALANVNKLVQLAREYDVRAMESPASAATAHEPAHAATATATAEGGRNMLASFVEWLEECRQAEVQEADAPPAPEPGEGMPDAVRIMTVHAAKGLEFPVVFVPDLGREFNPFIGNRDEYGRWLSNTWQPSAEFGCVAQVVREPGGDSEETLAYAIQRGEQLDAERDEAKRLLYVACTRARELLFLTGHCDHQGPPPPYDEAKCPAQWIRRFIEHNSEPVATAAAGRDAGATADAPAEPPAAWDGTLKRLPDSLPGVCETLRLPGGDARDDTRVRLWQAVPEPPRRAEIATLAQFVADDLAAGRPLQWPVDPLGPPAAAYRARVEAHANRLLAQPSGTAAEPPVVAATAFATYWGCPLRYYVTQVLGLDGHAHVPLGLLGPADAGPAAVVSASSAAGEAAALPAFASLASEAENGYGEALPEPDDFDGELGSRDVGSYVHRVLELLRLGRLLPGLASAAAEPDAWLDDALQRAAVPPAAQTEVRGLVERFWRSPIAAELRQATDVEQESPFLLDFGEGAVVGAVDLCYRPAAGEVTVVDYKTTRLADEQDLPRMSQEYRRQLELYVLAAAARHGVDRVRAGLAFLRHDRVAWFAYDAARLANVSEDARAAMSALVGGEYAPPAGPCAACALRGQPGCAHWAAPAQPISG